MTKTKIVGNYMPAKYPDPYSDMEGDWTVWDCRLASQRSPKPNEEHLAGYEVSVNPSKQYPLCKFCHHHHLPGFGNCRD